MAGVLENALLLTNLALSYHRYGRFTMSIDRANLRNVGIT
jgi:hypothetical protein